LILVSKVRLPLLRSHLAYIRARGSFERRLEHFRRHPALSLEVLRGARHKLRSALEAALRRQSAGGEFMKLTLG
jgi:hypothetical protein